MLLLRGAQQYHSFLAEHLEVSEQISFTYEIWVSSDKVKATNKSQEIFLVGKCYIQGAPRKEKYRCFFHGAPRISRTNKFYTSNLGEKWQIKINKQESGLFPIWEFYAQAAPRKKQYRCFFGESLRVFKQEFFFTWS